MEVDLLCGRRIGAALERLVSTHNLYVSSPSLLNAEVPTDTQRRPRGSSLWWHLTPRSIGEIVTPSVSLSCNTLAGDDPSKVIPCLTLAR